MVEPTKFTLVTQSVLLTYSQCPAPRETVRDMIQAKVPVEKGVIGQEEHQDGNKHLHAYIKFGKRLSTRDCRYFDIEWEGQTYHPNIASAKNAYGAVKYCVKEDKTPLEIGTMDHK